MRDLRLFLAQTEAGIKEGLRRRSRIFRPCEFAAAHMRRRSKFNEGGVVRLGVAGMNGDRQVGIANPSTAARHTADIGVLTLEGAERVIDAISQIAALDRRETPLKVDDLCGALIERLAHLCRATFGSSASFCFSRSLFWIFMTATPFWHRKSMNCRSRPGVMSRMLKTSPVRLVADPPIGRELARLRRGAHADHLRMLAA
jgi:hypothetical protein